MLIWWLQLTAEMSACGRMVPVASTSLYLPRDIATTVHTAFFGYIWSTSEGDYDCAASARKSNNGQNNFCVWTDGEHGVVIPPTSTADCNNLSDGRIGVIFASTSVPVQV